jgi:hypothetical protein
MIAIESYSLNSSMDDINLNNNTDIVFNNSVKAQPSARDTGASDGTGIYIGGGVGGAAALVILFCIIRCCCC